MTQPVNNPDPFSPIEEAVGKFRSEIAGLTTERDYWKTAAEAAAAETAWAESRLTAASDDGSMFPPIVAPGVPFRDLVLSTGRRIRFTANFAVISTILTFLAEDGVDPEALASMDINDATKLAVSILTTARTEEIFARGGMALQPNENWLAVLAQLTIETVAEKVAWLVTAAVVGVEELANAGGDDGQGEAPEPSAA